MIETILRERSGAAEEVGDFESYVNRCFSALDPQTFTGSIEDLTSEVIYTEFLSEEEGDFQKNKHGNKMIPESCQAKKECKSLGEFPVIPEEINGEKENISDSLRLQPLDPSPKNGEVQKLSTDEETNSPRVKKIAHVSETAAIVLLISALSKLLKRLVFCFNTFSPLKQSYIS